MRIFELLARLLFFPGTFVLKILGITVEEDSGILRSFINSIFWGAIVLTIALQFFN